MKLNTKHTSIERGGVQAETNFTIKTNALSFSILSGGLYTDPIMAIVRELSCNAYDAHTDANNAATPFEIHLPNDLEPFLSIKDFGTGLADEDIQGEMLQNKKSDGSIDYSRSGGLYTTYFDSTKTQSNEFIGALGLGSKSPFSYSDAFEVISRYGGTKSTYAIFLNENGIPTVALMGTIETDEHSGLEIKITIKREDFHTFAARTSEALKFFKVKPTINGATHFTFAEIPKKRIETDKWMLSRSSGYYNSSITAVQGNVQYKVTTDQIKAVLSTEVSEFINKTNIILFFNIGDLEVAANREEIRYDKRSITAIAAGINEIYETLTSEIEKHITDLHENLWDATIDLNALSQELFNNSSFITENVNIDEITVPMLREYITKGGTVSFTEKFGYNVYAYGLRNTYKSFGSCKRQKMKDNFVPKASMAVIINDVKKSSIKRLGEFLENSAEFSECILITPRKTVQEHFDTSTKESLPYMGMKKELEVLKKDLGEPEILLLSEITTAESAISCTVDLAMYSYHGTRQRNYSSWSSERILSWERESFDVEVGGMYIPLKFGNKPALINGKILEEIDYVETKTMHGIINLLVTEYNDQHGTEFSFMHVYGLPSTTCKKVVNDSTWVNLFDFGYSISHKHTDRMSFYNKLNNTTNLHGIKDAIKVSQFGDMVRSLPNTSAFKKIFKPIIDGFNMYTEKDLDDMLSLSKLEKLLMLSPQNPAETFFDDKTLNKYSMLGFVINYDSLTDWKSILEYIKMVDRSK